MNLLFISLGCDKNLVDSEVMLGLLAKEGYQMVLQKKDIRWWMMSRKRM